MLFVAVCTLGQVRIEHEMAMANAKMPMGMERRLSVIMGIPTVDARNLAVKMAMDAGAKYLLFWDDDVVPRDRNAVLHMVNVMEQLPIDLLGGVYPRRGAIPEPIVVKEEGGGVWWGWEEGGVYPVYMTGTGFLLIRMESLERVQSEPYALTDGTQVNRLFSAEHGYSDDFQFADLAAENGLKWCVAGSVVCDQIDLDGTHYTIERAKILA